MEWFFVVPAGASAPWQCAFTVAITKGGVEANETAVVPGVLAVVVAPFRTPLQDPRH